MRLTNGYFGEPAFKRRTMHSYAGVGFIRVHPRPSVANNALEQWTQLPENARIIAGASKQ